MRFSALTRKSFIAAAILVAIAVAMAGCSGAYSGSGSGKNIPMLVPAPDVVGMTLEGAEAALDELNLKHTTEESDGSHAWVFVKSNWRVDAQDPGPRTEMTEGDAVKLTVTNLDKEAEAAKKAEEEAARERDRQEQEAAEQAAREAEEAQKTATVPDVRGMGADDVRTLLGDAGLGATFRRTSGASVMVIIGANWRVVSQSPEAGEKAKPGDDVTLTVERPSSGEATKDDPINWMTASSYMDKVNAYIKKEYGGIGPNRYGEYADEVVYSDGYVVLYCSFWSALEEVGKVGDRALFEREKVLYQYDMTSPEYRARFIEAYNTGGYDAFFGTFTEIFNEEVWPAYQEEFRNG